MKETKQDGNRRRQREYRERHLERNRKKQRDWKRQERINHPERVRLRSRVKGIKRFYGITLEEYEVKLASQNNLCGLCGKPFDATQEKTRPTLDHRHSDGKLRDFLHSNCNRGIGFFYDDADVLIKAAEYLRRHENQ